MTVNPEQLLEQLEPKAKLWLELNGYQILGKGGALLLRAIAEHGSISQAIQSVPPETLGKTEPPSYRFAWGYLNKVETRLGVRIVKKQRGHKSGVGGTELTQFGQKLLRLYELLENQLNKTLKTTIKSLKAQLI
jgi:molybdate transport system regulatory protein